MGQCLLEMCLNCGGCSSGLVSGLRDLHASATERIKEQFTHLHRRLLQKQAEQLEMLDLVRLGPELFT